MNKPLPDARAGFSLVEVIAVLILVGFISSMAGFMVVPVISAFDNTRAQMDLADRANLFMSRIEHELQNTTNVTASGSSSISYSTRDKSGAVHSRTVSWPGPTGASIFINGHRLIDDVTALQFRYFDQFDATAQSYWTTNSSLIEIVLDLGVSGSLYTNRVFLRSMN